MQALEQANAQQDMNRSLLRITYILQQRKDIEADIIIQLIGPRRARYEEQSIRN